MRLRHATIAQDEASEAQANTFVRGTSDNNSDMGGIGRETDNFVKEFREMRKTYHMRAMWADRWQRGDVAWPDD
jgi:ESCRT-I complex subunit VPS37